MTTEQLVEAMDEITEALDPYEYLDNVEILLFVKSRGCIRSGTHELFLEKQHGFLCYIGMLSQFRCVRNLLFFLKRNRIE